jgi:beta-lactamase class A
LGIKEFQLQDGEHGLHRDPTAQYRNWISPTAAVQLLERLIRNSPLSSEANNLLVQTLTDSVTGGNRLRAGLPVGTILAHKTGTSGEHDGKAAATNDIGLITFARRSPSRRCRLRHRLTRRRSHPRPRNRSDWPRSLRRGITHVWIEWDSQAGE